MSKPYYTKAQVDALLNEVSSDRTINVSNDKNSVLLDGNGKINTPLTANVKIDKQTIKAKEDGTLYAEVPEIIDNYGPYLTMEDALLEMGKTGKDGNQFTVNSNGVAKLYLYQGPDKEPTEVGEGMMVKQGDGYISKNLKDNTNPLNNKDLKLKRNSYDFSDITGELPTETGSEEYPLYGVYGTNCLSFGDRNIVNGEHSYVISHGGLADGKRVSIFGGMQNKILDPDTKGYSFYCNITGGWWNEIISSRNSGMFSSGYSKIIHERNGEFSDYNTIIGSSYSTIRSLPADDTFKRTSKNNSIVAGYKNQIEGRYNAIIGGINNIILKEGTHEKAFPYSTVILGGEENKAQGYHQVVGGYGNHAVTVGEVLFGLYGTIQNTTLDGWDYIPDSRIFNIGIGYTLGNGTIIKRDGFSVYRNGLATFNGLSTVLIDANPKAPITKEYYELNNVIYKSGDGFNSLDKKTNPTKYRTKTLTNQGRNSYDLTFGATVKPDEKDKYGLVGGGSFAYGTNTRVTAMNSIVMANSSIVEGFGASVFGGRYNNIYDTEQQATPEDVLFSSYGTYNSIISTDGGVITDGDRSSIVGGFTNSIFGDKTKKNKPSYNIIIGGYNNKILNNTKENALGSIILSGGENTAKGHYNTVGGYHNHAITAGETLFGIYSTIQNENLSGFDHINNSRVFNIGVGFEAGNGVVSRKDGFSIYRDGLATFSNLTLAQIEANPKAPLTKEWANTYIKKADNDTLGLVKPDGETTKVDEHGALSVNIDEDTLYLENGKLKAKQSSGGTGGSNIVEYVHSGNKEVAVSSIDYTTNTFTSNAHGLVNGDRVVFNKTVDCNILTHTPFSNGWNVDSSGGGWFVVNSTTNTFQLSLTNAGSPIALTERATNDFTKWKIEVMPTVNSIGVNNLNATSLEIEIVGPTFRNTRYLLNNQGIYNGYRVRDNNNNNNSSDTGIGATLLSDNYNIFTNHSIKVNVSNGVEFIESICNSTKLVDSKITLTKDTAYVQPIRNTPITNIPSLSFSNLKPMNGTKIIIQKIK